METYNLTPEEESKKIAFAYRDLMYSLKFEPSSTDKKVIKRAFEMANNAHSKMRRKSGEPYIFHPIAVAKIVAEEMGLGSRAIVCALLHDVVEDTEVTVDDIKSAFDSTTAKIVAGLTKITGMSDLNYSLQADNFRKLLLTLTDDIRVILVKLADRLHNMRTMESMPRHKQLKIASETTFIYAPLAHRLGLNAVKNELEDLSLKYTAPDDYANIQQKLDSSRASREAYVENFIEPVKELLEETVNYPFEMYGRSKSISSIYNKIKNKHVPFEEVYDLFAIRIIPDVPIEQERNVCWNLFSMITSIYSPNSARNRDWLSHPKTNGYEALHTTVMGPKGKWIEVQIRSKRMHEIAEMGVAAHWKYKEGTNSTSKIDEWLGKINESLKDPNNNSLELIDNIKSELEEDEVFVFTPNGDLKQLSGGATALDFAYEIHSDVGSKCIGAKIDHKLVPLNYKLQNGDQLEVITSKNQKPTEDWLTFVKTSKAKTYIKRSLRREQLSIAEDGKEIVMRKFKQKKIDFTDYNINILLERSGCKEPTELFYKLAKRKLNVGFLRDYKVEAGKLVLPEPEKPAPTKTEQFEPMTAQKVSDVNKAGELLIMGESSKNIDYKIAQCCKPIPSDPVIGFITINEGVKIHKSDCPNAIHMAAQYGHRIVKVSWSGQYDTVFETSIVINGIDKVGVIGEISNVLTDQMHLNMKSMSISSDAGTFTGTITLEVSDVSQLDQVIEKLKAKESILSVERRDF